MECDTSILSSWRQLCCRYFRGNKSGEVSDKISFRGDHLSRMHSGTFLVCPLRSFIKTSAVEKSFHLSKLPPANPKIYLTSKWFPFKLHPFHPLPSPFQAFTRIHHRLKLKSRVLKVTSEKLPMLNNSKLLMIRHLL